MHKSARLAVLLILSSLGICAVLVAGMQQSSIIFNTYASLHFRLPSSRRAYFCPLATSPRPSDPFLKDSLSPFTPLESIMPEFNLFLAYALSACNQFRIKIVRTDPKVCQQMKERLVSENEEVQEFVTSKLGPDTFHVRVDGAERLVVNTPVLTDSLSHTTQLYNWDPYIDNKIDCSRVNDTSAVVLSSGSWQAGAAPEIYSTSVFTSHMSLIFESWPQSFAKCRPLGSPPPTLIYLTSPAFAYPQVPFLKGDRRTGPRLEYWNDVAKRLALENGWSVVDAFAHSRSFATDTVKLDGVHYLKTDAIDPIADEVIQKLGICDIAS
ncbi:hypothetical protein P7C70_g2151, partial [Phenoliferia sp. Uapishka_3]